MVVVENYCKVGGTVRKRERVEDEKERRASAT